MKSFNICNFSTKHFLNGLYDMQMSELMMSCIASQFSINFVHRNDENTIFQL